MLIVKVEVFRLFEEEVKKLIAKNSEVRRSPARRMLCFLGVGRQRNIPSPEERDSKLEIREAQKVWIVVLNKR